MKKFLIQRLIGINRDQGGQSMIMVTIILFTLVCFFAFTINVGHRINHRVELQNAADAATYSAASWNARGLNLVCILNVGMAECLALIILAKAFDRCIEKTLGIWYVVSQAAADLLAACIFCGPGQAVGLFWSNMLRAWQGPSGGYGKLMQSFANTLSEIIDPMWTVMATLQGFELTAKYVAPATGFYRADSIAREMKLSPVVLGLHAVVLPANPLPIEEDGGFEAICQQTMNLGDWKPAWLKNNLVSPHNKAIDIRSDLGIDFGRIKSALERYHLWPGAVSLKELLRIILVGFNVPPPGILNVPALTWGSYVDGSANSICDQVNNRPFPVTNVTRNIDECRDNRGTAKWRGADNVLVRNIYPGDRARTTDKSNLLGKYIPLNRPSRCIDVRDSPSRDSYNSIGPPSGALVSRNPAETYTTGNWSCREECLCENDSVCEPCENRNTDEADVVGTKRIRKNYFTSWTLEQCTYEGEESFDNVDTSSKPTPLMLSGNWAANLKFTGIFNKQVSDRLNNPLRIGDSTGEASFGSSYRDETSNVAVSCAEVYNPDQNGEDLFNQNWRVKLKPCTLEDFNPDVLNLSDEFPEIKALIGDTDGFVDTWLGPISDKLLLH